MIMTESSTRLISVAATVVLLGAILLLYFDRSLFSPAPIVIIFQIAAFLLSLWARLTLRLHSFHFAADPTADALVTSGPYRFVRNPIYTAVWLFTWSGIAAHLSLIAIALGLLVLAALVARILCEECHLRERFAAYSAYARRTARLIPFVL
jgi:protein-S-isoprenylcysteine O-methyltransferase Ste14